MFAIVINTLIGLLAFGFVRLNHKSPRTDRPMNKYSASVAIFMRKNGSSKTRQTSVAKLYINRDCNPRKLELYT